MLYWLPAEVVAGPGALAMLPLPGGRLSGRDLATDLAELASAGISLLVTLNSAPELDHVAEPDYFTRVRQSGLESIHFPILDGGAPHDLRATDALVADLDARVGGGEKVGLHCLAGLGRTGTLAACFLVRRGETYNSSIRIVRAVRSPHAVETAVQEAFVRTYYDWVRLQRRR